MAQLQSNQRLFEGLEKNGVSYAVRASDRGVPYAGFRRVDSSDGFETSVTAILEEDNLRFTFHNVAAPGDLKSVALLNRSLPLGGVYRAPETQQAELSLAMHTDATAELSGLMQAILAYGLSACRWIAGSGDVPALPVLSTGGASDDAGAANALRRIELNPSPIAHGAAAAFPGPPRLSLSLRGQPAGWLQSEGRYDPPASPEWGDKELALFQRLQRWTVAGRFLLEPDGELRAEVLTPAVDGTSPSGEWTATQAIVMLQTAAKHLGIAR